MRPKFQAFFFALMAGLYSDMTAAQSAGGSPQSARAGQPVVVGAEASSTDIKRPPKATSTTPSKVDLAKLFGDDKTIIVIPRDQLGDYFKSSPAYSAPWMVGNFNDLKGRTNQYQSVLEVPGLAAALSAENERLRRQVTLLEEKIRILEKELGEKGKK